MAKRVKRLRHAIAQALAFVGFDGELTVDTTNKSIRVHDASTPGGFEQARADLANAITATNAVDGKMTAVQVQNLEAVVIESAQNVLDIANEITNRIADVDTEETRALAAEASLLAKIETEELARALADTILQNNINAIIGTIYPVGATYISTVGTNPASVLGIGTWTKTAVGRAIIGDGTSDAVFTAGATGGQSVTPDHLHAKGTLDATADSTALASGLTGAMSGTDFLAFSDLGSTSHSHTGNVTGSTANGGSHTNLPPYEVFHIWKRTA